jgi:hypothetical protein
MTKTVNINTILEREPVFFRFTYRPEFKDRLRNWSGEVFMYEGCLITREFSSEGYPAGLQADVNGEPRRFSYCNVISVEVGR